MSKKIVEAMLENKSLTAQMIKEVVKEDRQLWRIILQFTTIKKGLTDK